MGKMFYVNFKCSIITMIFMENLVRTQLEYVHTAPFSTSIIRNAEAIRYLFFLPSSFYLFRVFTVCRRVNACIYCVKHSQFMQMLYGKGNKRYNKMTDE